MIFCRRIAALFLLVIVTGCSSDKADVKPSPLVSFTPAAKFHVRWQHVSGQSGDSCPTPSICFQRNTAQSGAGTLQLAVTAESVITANARGNIQCFNLETGKLRWDIDSTFAISGGVGAGGEAVVVGGDKGDVAVFEESSGKLRWRSKVSSEVLSAPKIADGVVVVRTEDGRITGLDAKDGKSLWLYERANPALVARGNAGVTIRNGIVYAGFAAGKLSAIGLHNGVVVWESSVSQPHGNTELERISDIISPPIVADSQVCAVAFQGRIGCFDAEQGGALWSRDISSDKGLTISRKYLFLTDSGDIVWGLDKLSGSTYWKNDHLAFRKVTVPLALENFLLVADVEGYLHALNRDDGSIVARMSTDGSAIYSAMVAAGDGFLVLTSAGSLYFVTIH